MLIIPLLCKFINSVYFMLQHVSIWHPVPNVGHGAGGVHVVFRHSSNATAGELVAVAKGLSASPLTFALGRSHWDLYHYITPCDHLEKNQNVLKQS